MFSDLMKEVSTAKKKEVAGKNVNLDPTIHVAQQKAPVKKEADEIEDMLANL